LVITVSSLIIGIVLASTVIGYSLYVEWKNNSFALRYKKSISKLTAEMLRKDIGISNVKVIIGKDKLFFGLPFMEGSLKNNTQKSVASIQMEVSFTKPNGSVIYKNLFHPIGEERFSGFTALTGVEHTRNILLPGESLSFRHLMRKCPPEVVSQFSSESDFARSDPGKKITINYSIIGMTVQ
jgi:hypothetical protein